MMIQREPEPGSVVKTALVTGASRGIGAEVSRLLATRGVDVAVNFRNKKGRAEEVVRDIEAQGRRGLLAGGDLTLWSDLERMMTCVARNFGHLDILVLNASGGLEKDKPASYAMDLNVHAQTRTLGAALGLMPRGGSVVFVTSHWAHFFGQKPVHEGYEAIAASKQAGEEALRARIPVLASRGVRLAIVSGDMIDGTITPKLLERTHPGLIAARRAAAGGLPTVTDFAAAIVAAALDSARPSGTIDFVGAMD